LAAVRSEILDYWPGVGVMRFEGETDLGFMRVHDRPNTFEVMERHLRTPEMLFALDGDVLLPVSLDAGGSSPDIDRMTVLRIEKGTGVLMARGVWHAIPFPSGGSVTCLVVFRRNTSVDDLEVVSLPVALHVAASVSEAERGDRDS
jgi:ureidoglycolate lyase